MPEVRDRDGGGVSSFDSELGGMEIAAPAHWPRAQQALSPLFFTEPTHRKAAASRAVSQLTVHPGEIKCSCKFLKWLV